MQDRQFICLTSEITPDSPYRFIWDNQIEVVVFQAAGDYYALENRCPHAGAQLHQGIVKDKTLTCIWHGWQFDLETGQCFNEYWARVLTYPVVVEGNRLYLLKPP